MRFKLFALALAACLFAGHLFLQRRRPNMLIHSR